MAKFPSPCPKGHIAVFRAKNSDFQNAETAAAELALCDTTKEKELTGTCGEEAHKTQREATTRAKHTNKKNAITCEARNESRQVRITGHLAPRPNAAARRFLPNRDTPNLDMLPRSRRAARISPWEF